MTIEELAQPGPALGKAAGRRRPGHYVADAT